MLVKLVAKLQSGDFMTVLTKVVSMELPPAVGMHISYGPVSMQVSLVRWSEHEIEDGVHILARLGDVSYEDEDTVEEYTEDLRERGWSQSGRDDIDWF